MIIIFLIVYMDGVTAGRNCPVICFNKHTMPLN